LKNEVSEAGIKTISLFNTGAFGFMQIHSWIVLAEISAFCIPVFRVSTAVKIITKFGKTS
jgi:hypothetical protein